MADPFQEAIEPFVIIGKLKGERATKGPLEHSIDEVKMLKNEIIMLRADLSRCQMDITDLRYNLQKLVRAVVKPFDPSTSSDITSLKSSYNIW